MFNHFEMVILMNSSILFINHLIDRTLISSLANIYPIFDDRACDVNGIGIAPKRRQNRLVSCLKTRQRLNQVIDRRLQRAHPLQERYQIHLTVVHKCFVEFQNLKILACIRIAEKKIEKCKKSCFIVCPLRELISCKRSLSSHTERAL